MSGRGDSTRLPPWRRRLVLGLWLTASAAICVRAGQIQLAQATAWGTMAEAQHQTDVEVPATRGSILDRDGAPLAVSRERLRVSVAPRELVDVETAQTRLVESLGLSRSAVTRLTSRNECGRWHRTYTLPRCGTD